MSEEPLGAKPAPDVAEQQRPVSDAERDDDDGLDDARDAPLEADTADVAEQHRSVPAPPDDEF
jgi:hypothetical protein